MKKTMKSGSIGVKGTGGSAKQGTSTGSGARPGKSKYPIGSSAPTDMRELGRAPAGYLK